ncbi:MAG: hypothetical protein Ct9H90mP22_7630 [Gammaproteobacteria bacterium]|nr:MAG: hypothetical protein Ct9H90mP22_7630 [Gammaproteobacteria bacterium]
MDDFVVQKMSLGTLIQLMVQEVLLPESMTLELLYPLVINDELIGGVIDCPALGERWTSFNVNETKVNQKITKCKAVDD